ncbi:peptide deformylase [Candidatus Epulonipiscium fishelsonii]|uniref:Peptide deformylase n=1 Tax=Candidatus Epulonipiscium fishelsonii TaxID=77094 RepID=A0ACC8XDZ0_9FIRM|nr:peptide deformylase [Epulopiscium sp. SCG-B05WGA-EpuloA1]ONI41062.1 peptide deformylase [Epulopiscium sp. SCG-B11WGA-EpuloA1]ONI47940.1 peptide deformylase [Epulopiscium sp. SCG-C06WGA-EpuloA1]
MALRTIRIDDDPILRKVSKPVKNFDKSLEDILNDMIETMHHAEGVGLAAPQIGILKRIFIIDIGEGVIEFINPEILEHDEEQIGEEGCLSVPGRYAIVKRPLKVKVKAQNKIGEYFEVEAVELKARAILHEYDHLEGILYVDNIEGELKYGATRCDMKSIA